jgi:hypothetical protein
MEHPLPHPTLEERTNNNRTLADLEIKDPDQVEDQFTRETEEGKR